MKLRNIKTGEITDLSKNGFLKSDNDDHIIVYQEGTLKYYAYNSLAELNAEWEDYKPKEPLIKDENVRKVVQAWVNNLKADMCDGAIAFYVDTAYCTFQVDVWKSHNSRDIAELDLVFDYDGLDDGATYTISELCGEEEQ